MAGAPEALRAWTTAGTLWGGAIETIRDSPSNRSALSEAGIRAEPLRVPSCPNKAVGLR